MILDRRYAVRLIIAGCAATYVGGYLGGLLIGTGFRILAAHRQRDRDEAQDKPASERDGVDDAQWRDVDGPADPA